MVVFVAVVVSAVLNRRRAWTMLASAVLATLVAIFVRCCHPVEVLAFVRYRAWLEV